MKEKSRKTKKFLKSEDVGFVHRMADEQTKSLIISKVNLWIKDQSGYTAVVIAVMFMSGLPWWAGNMDDDSFLKNEIPLYWSVISLVFGALILGAMFFFYGRVQAVRRHRLKCKIHLLARQIRIQHGNFLKRHQEAKVANDSLHTNQQRRLFKNDADELARLIVEYVQELIGDEEVGCVIRLAEGCVDE